MRYLVVITNAKNWADFQANKTYHFVEARSAEEAQATAMAECYQKGPWGIPFSEGEKVHVDRCMKQNAGEIRD